MNDKNKEAFEKWWQHLYDNHVEFRDWQGCELSVEGKEDMRYGWQAACEYKQKEIDAIDCYIERDETIKKLQAENKKLKQIVEKATTVIKRCEFGLQPEFYGGKDNGSLKDCREFLKELEASKGEE